jgi:hypothetical protein
MKKTFKRIIAFSLRKMKHQLYVIVLSKLIQCTCSFTKFHIDQKDVENYLKNIVRRFLVLVFLNQSNPYTSRSLINRLKPFRIWLRISQDIRFESRRKIGLFPRGNWSRGNGFRGVSDHTESYSLIYLGDFEAICEMSLARSKKIEGRKSHVPVTLYCYIKIQ